MSPRHAPALTGFIFTSPAPILDAFEATRGPSQRDKHVAAYRWQQRLRASQAGIAAVAEFVAELCPTRKQEATS